VLEEIAVRERATIAEVLGRDEIGRIADGSGSGPARASALIEALRKIRFPRLRKMQERLRAEVAALKLPRGISVDLPKELGSDELTVSLRVRSADDLGRLIAALNQSARWTRPDSRDAWRRAGRKSTVKTVKMKFDLDAVFIEHGCVDSALAARIIRAIPADVPVHHVTDAREVAMSTRDQFGAGKRTMIISRRKTPS